MWNLVCSKYIDLNLHARLCEKFCSETGAHIKFGTECDFCPYTMYDVMHDVWWYAAALMTIKI